MSKYSTSQAEVVVGFDRGSGRTNSAFHLVLEGLRGVEVAVVDVGIQQAARNSWLIAKPSTHWVGGATKDNASTRLSGPVGG